MNFCTNPFRLLTFVLVLFAASYALADEGGGRTIRGRIVDAKSGEALIGVNVTIQGTTSGVASGIDGSFQLTARPDAMLVFSYVGYEPLTVKASEAAVRTLFQMEEESNALDEVVVVGYSTVQRRHIISSVSTVKGDAIENRPVANVQQALQGAAANLIIQTKSFDPTNQSVNMSIRGVNTIGNNSPLLVIDGVPQSDAGRMNDLNPNDIASVNILKDAGAAAIYGARSSNGVILITTKSGSREMAPRVRFSAQIGVENPDILYSQVPTWRNALLRNEALTNVGGNPLFTSEEIRDFYEHGDSQSFVDLAMKNALQQNYNLSVTGGSKSTTYMLSAGYYDQQTNYAGDYGTTRYNLRSNISTEFGRLKLGANISFTRAETKQPTTSSFLFADLVRFPAYYFYRHKEGNVYFGNNYKYGGYDISPLAALEAGGSNRYDNEYLTGTLTADFELVKGLKARAILGGEVRHEHRFSNHLSYLKAVDSGTTHVDPSTAVPAGSTDHPADDWVGKTTYVSAQLMLDYNRTFAEKHNVSGLFGWADESNIFYGITAGKKYLNDINVPGEGTIVDENTSLSTQSRTRSALQSFFGRAAYSYDDRYYAEFTARYDMSSKFLKVRNGAFFPAVSLGWRMSQEAFMESWRERVGDLKLRTSYGLNGNQQDVGLYDFMTTYGLWQNAYGFNGKPVQGLMFTMGNEFLTWETAKTFNIGLDATFLQNQLSVSFDYFYKRTEDILLPPVVPGTFGASIAKENRGVLDNQGWEVTVNYNLTRGKWKHSFSLNVADSHNEVVKYGDPNIHENDGVNTLTQEGLPLNAYYGYRTDGFFQSMEEIETAAIPTEIDRSQLRPGDVRYVDQNGDGVINEQDRIYLGYGFPRYTFGFTYNLSWRGLDLGIMLQGVMKRTNAIRGELIEPFHSDYSMTMFDHQLDYWTPNNRNAAYPRLGTSGSVSQSNNWKGGSDIYMLDGAYLRVKNIQIGYTLPSRWTRKFGCQSLRIYFDTQNPLTWTKNGFVDPETSEFGGNMSRGGANSARNYPTLRYFGGGIDLTF